jgi:lipopolysaccharide/colanic/teichoic acid biosynthesis glycosyltransferase
MSEEISLAGDSALRRLVDLLFGIPAMVLLLPVFALIAVAIKLDSRGPVFYAQERMGKDDSRFPILKFRSMVTDADRMGPGVSSRADARITRLGHWLRGTKIDELPQLLNLVRGQVTLIGPRAEVERYREFYTVEELLLLGVRPGMTGPGQLFFTTHQSVELDEVDDPETFYIEHQLHPKLAMDLEYLRRRGLWTDLVVVGRTIAVLLGGSGDSARRTVAL